MATTFVKNQVVRLKAVIPSGPVEKLRMDEDGTVYYMISWVDADGVSQSRWFAEDELVAVE
jgi:uncharacterized protein YodC (DUF2158 family)